MMDGQTRLHRFRYYCSAGFVEKEDVVLDLGCGSGYGTEILSRNAKEVIGIDIESGNIAACEIHFKGKKKKFVEADLEKMDLPECDVAVGMEVIEHLYEPAEFLKKLKKKTKKLIILSVPLGKTTDTDGSHHYDFMSQGELDNMVRDEKWDLFYFMFLHVSCFAVYLKKEAFGL